MTNYDYFNQLFDEKCRNKEEQLYRCYQQLSEQQVSSQGLKKLEDILQECRQALYALSLSLRSNFYREMEECTFQTQKEFCSFCHQRLEGKIESLLVDEEQASETRLKKIIEQDHCA